MDQESRPTTGRSRMGIEPPSGGFFVSSTSRTKSGQGWSLLREPKRSSPPIKATFDGQLIVAVALSPREARNHSGQLLLTHLRPLHRGPSGGRGRRASRRLWRRPFPQLHCAVPCPVDARIGAQPTPISGPWLGRRNDNSELAHSSYSSTASCGILSRRSPSRKARSSPRFIRLRT